MEFSQIPNMAEVITVSDSSVIKYEVQEALPNNIEELFDIPDFSLFPKRKVVPSDNFPSSSRPSKVEPETYELGSTYFNNEENDVGKQKVSHSGRRPFECGICKKRFATRVNLSCHQRTHIGDRPFECDICKKCFATGVTLSCHQRTHTGDKPFECDICEKTFRRKAHLFIHQRTHTGEKPFECDICKKCFTLSHGLSSHKRIHTGEKPFKCDVCEKRFNTRSSLSRHQRSQHLM